VWPWLVIAGLGAYHGINPAMGWLFAVALGLHRKSRAVVAEALVPIALGHALSVAIVAAAVVALGATVDGMLLRRTAGIALILWALYHLLYGARHRVRVGMQAGFAGLFLWSFLMASAHGAGLMLLPALIPLCLPMGPATSGSPAAALAAIGLHTATMLLVTGAIALAVYEWIGVAFLRRGWVNLDRLWVLALIGAGLWLLAA
jgi:hypothetical protein